MYWLVVAGLFIINGCLADPRCSCPSPFTLCQGIQPVRNGELCLEEYLKSVLYQTLRGTTCSGPNQMDPLFIGEILSDFATLQYNSTNNTITGLSRSTIPFIKASDDIQMVTFKLDVPSFLIEGALNFTGYLLYLTGSGNGKADVEYGRTLIKVYALLTQVIGSNNCKYLQFGNFSINPLSLSPFEFDIDQIYDDCNKDVTRQRNYFMEEHWDDICFFGQGPVLNPVIQKLLEFSNEYLLNVPMNDLIDYYNNKKCCPYRN